MPAAMSSKNDALDARQIREHVAGGGRQARQGFLLGAGEPPPEAEMAAAQQRDRRRAHRSRFGRTAHHGRLRPRPIGERAGGRQRAALPHHLARVAERVEPLALVVLDAVGQNVDLPAAGRHLEALELGHHVLEPARPRHPLAVRHVLPGEQEAQVGLGRDRLDLGAQSMERAAVDASEEAALAPLLDAEGGVNRPRSAKP